MSQLTGSVACGHTGTATAAVEILRAGGNAADAAIAGFFAACVCEPVLASPGGGGFAMVGFDHRPPRLLDFFTQTPVRCRSVDELDFESVWVDFGSARQEFHIGWGSVATPGAVRGMFELHRQYASMPMTALVESAIELIRSGVAVSSQQAEVLTLVEPIYIGRPGARKIFSSSSEPGRVARAGEVVAFSDLADFLDTLAREGDDLFYRGEFSALVDAGSASGGGSVCRADFEAYEAIWRQPLQTTFRDATVWLNPPPSAGGCLVMFALSLLSQLEPLIEEDDYFLAIAECLDSTNEARLKSTGSQPWPDLDKLFGEEMVEKYSRQLMGHRAAWRGTTHLSVADSQGNSIGITVSNGEGCGEVISGTGVMMNNMLGEEDLNPQGFHQWQCDQRMSSMMSPTIVRMAERMITLGSGGSNRIRSSILQSIVQMIDRGLAPEQAVLFPRIHLEGSTLNIEGDIASDVLQKLYDRFPEYNQFDGRNFFFGGVHSVVVTPQDTSGAGDPRRAGVCMSV